MKKIFLTIATAALFSISVFAADGGKKANESAATVSYAVQNQFTADFAGAQDVVWSVTKNVQKASFVIDGTKKTAFYNLSGDFLGTTQVVGYNAIPAKTQAIIADTYKGYVAGDVIVYQTNEEVNSEIDPTSYFVDLKNSDHELLVRVTGSGKVEFFKQVK
ncbi:MAG TPA: hypothetical protein VGI43_17755 [Mucilaginibacter sp.]|jgi:hypothetical protein